VWLAVQAHRAACADVDDDLSAVATVSNVIEVVQNASPADRAGAAGSISSSFDIEAIAKIIAGDAWTTASAKQKNEFLDALLNATMTIIFERMNERQSAGIDFGKVRHLPNGDTLVGTKVTRPSGRIVDLGWRLRPCKANLCIVDLIVDGASMALQLRDEAAPILAANGGAIGELSLRLRYTPTHPFN
jgi:phospholipid transport system substrate-binding protein